MFWLLYLGAFLTAVGAFGAGFTFGMLAEQRRVQRDLDMMHRYWSRPSGE